MSDHEIVDSSFTAIINAPIGKIDIPAWAFALPDHEYQGASPAHVAAGFTKPNNEGGPLVAAEMEDNVKGKVVLNEIGVPRTDFSAGDSFGIGQNGGVGPEAEREASAAFERKHRGIIGERGCCWMGSADSQRLAINKDADCFDGAAADEERRISFVEEGCGSPKVRDRFRRIGIENALVQCADGGGEQGALFFEADGVGGEHFSDGYPGLAGDFERGASGVVSVLSSTDRRVEKPVWTRDVTVQLGGHPNRRDKLTTTTAITTAAVETPASQRLSSERASTGVMSRLYHRSTELTQLNSSAQPGCARDDTAGCEQTRGLPRCSDRVNPWTGQTGQQ